MPRAHLPFRAIEKRFQQLDEVQQKLKDSRDVRNARRDGTTPTAAAGTTTTTLGGSAYDATALASEGGLEGIDASARFAARASKAQSRVRDNIQSNIETNVTRLRARAARAIAEQKAMQVECAIASGSATTLPRYQNDDAATFLTDRGGHERFLPLFTEDAAEQLKQQRIIAQAVSAADADKNSSPEAGAAAASGTRGATHDDFASSSVRLDASRRLRRHVDRSPTRHVSPYANPQPPQMRQLYDRMRPATADAGGSASSSSKGGGGRHVFKQLPAVLPQKAGFKPLARRHNRPMSSSPGASHLPRGSASVTPTNHEHGGLSLGADDAIFTKEFYYLHVRLVETQARLTNWEFSVTITDVTDPQRLLRHTFRHLRVNPRLFLVFHPPHGVILSPVDDIPWVPSPESLFMHTLRIEVNATHPTHTKVVDTMVFFGDVVPDEGTVSSKFQPPSPQRPGTAQSGVSGRSGAVSAALGVSVA